MKTKYPKCCKCKKTSKTCECYRDFLPGGKALEKELKDRVFDTFIEIDSKSRLRKGVEA